MTRHRVSVAMTSPVHEDLHGHLLRPDGQEDICLATYRPSTGATRRTALVRKVITPLPGEREVHGNASITGDYVLRAAAIAHSNGEGLVLCHSHPQGRGWQTMSGPDRDAESSFANLVREITGQPLVGMTLAGRGSAWSARHWDRGIGTEVFYTEAENVRAIGDRLTVSWNDSLVAPPPRQRSQRRSISSWGQTTHDDLVRRSVLIVGLGSIGLDIAVRLAATGVTTVGFMDFDTIEERNLDRLIGVTVTDAWLKRPKIDAARRLFLENTTAQSPQLSTWDRSICEAAGLRYALDFDMIISCVDRPWPRAVLNALAYTDLIPVIDGGIAIDTFPGGDGMRNATWRSHVIRPGRSCMSCNGQLDLGEVAADIEGVLDDPQYVQGQDTGDHRVTGQNVAVLSMNAAASLLVQYVSFNVAPGGLGEPGPLQYVLSTNTLDHLQVANAPHCPYENAEAVGDSRRTLTGRHTKAETDRAHPTPANLAIGIRVGRVIDNAWWWGKQRLAAFAARRLTPGRLATSGPPGTDGPGPLVGVADNEQHGDRMRVPHDDGCIRHGDLCATRETGT